LKNSIKSGVGIYKITYDRIANPLKGGGEDFSYRKQTNIVPFIIMIPKKKFLRSSQNAL
jgi:hypothetical protein